MAKADTTIGFWLNDKRLIIVECRVSDKQLTLIKSVDADMPAGIMNKGQILDFDSLVSFSFEVLTEIRPATEFASINLIPGSYIIKRLETTADYAQSDSDIPFFEIRHQLLQDESNYYFSHAVMDSGTYLVAALKSHVDIKMKLLTSIGLVPVAVEPAQIILHNFFQFAADDDMLDALLLEVSTPYTTTALLINGVLYPGGSVVTDADLYESACKSTLRPIHIDTFIDDLSTEIKMAFENTGFNLKHQPPDYLVISGVHPNLTLAMEAENLSRSRIFLFEGIKKFKRIKMKGKHDNLTFPEMISALGLALRRPKD